MRNKETHRFMINLGLFPPVIAQKYPYGRVFATPFLFWNLVFVAEIKEKRASQRCAMFTQQKWWERILNWMCCQEMKKNHWSNHKHTKQHMKAAHEPWYIKNFGTSRSIMVYALLTEDNVSHTDQGRTAHTFQIRWQMTAALELLMVIIFLGLHESQNFVVLRSFWGS